MIHINRILLIDDDIISTTLSLKILRDMNISTTITSETCGKEALKTLSHCISEANTPNSIPDLILVDINMPGMNGFEFADAFNEMMKGKLNCTKIAIITSSSLIRNRVNAHLNPSISDYLNKPISPSHVKELKSFQPTQAA